MTHSNYDTHHENFDFHIEQLGEFDRPFATLLDDLADRGMLDSTLVVVMSEFGRTPRINSPVRPRPLGEGVVGGAGGLRASRAARSSARRTRTAPPSTDREVNGGHLFHTYLQAVGLDPTKNFYPNERPVPDRRPEGRGDQGSPGVSR